MSRPAAARRLLRHSSLKRAPPPHPRRDGRAASGCIRSAATRAAGTPARDAGTSGAAAAAHGRPQHCALWLRPRVRLGAGPCFGCGPIAVPFPVRAAAAHARRNRDTPALEMRARLERQPHHELRRLRSPAQLGAGPRFLGGTATPVHCWGLRRPPPSSTSTGRTARHAAAATARLKQATLPTRRCELSSSAASGPLPRRWWCCPVAPQGGGGATLMCKFFFRGAVGEFAGHTGIGGLHNCPLPALGTRN